MRITCPNCTASFELPTELLGRKGRALKCASCGHSWYQTAQVEQLDLAAVMGEKYVAQAKAAGGGQQRGQAQPVAAAGAAGAQRNVRPQVQAAAMGAQRQPANQPLPP